MASYKVFIKPSALKELKAVPMKDRQRISSKIQTLSENPRPIGCEKLSGKEKYRLRQGNYRIVYAIEDIQLVIYVVKIGHRRDVYKKQ